MKYDVEEGRNRKEMREPRVVARGTLTYAEKLQSLEASLRRSPSVIYFNRVILLNFFSKRTLYPTSSPRGTSSSAAVRVATAVVASLRGCVHATFLPLAHSSKRTNCGIWVVFPDPVSPETRMIYRFSFGTTLRRLEGFEEY